MVCDSVGLGKTWIGLRIDRIGTDFNTLWIHNFFPDEGLERLLGLVKSLQTKIQQIDATVGLDASVLGEAIDPKVFNTIKRIEQEDDSVIDEQEAEAELASDEGLVRQLAEFIKTAGAHVLNRPGVERSRVVTLLGQLAEPMPTAPVKELKQALAGYRKTGDVADFVVACETVAARYARRESNVAPAEVTAEPLARETLRLICFEFLS